VAGRHHHDPDGPRSGALAVRLDGWPAGEPAVDGEPTAEPELCPDLVTRRTRIALIAVVVIAVAVLVIALMLAAVFRGKANQLSASAAASNAALVEVGATAQVTGQVRQAVERVYSYDFARLDENEQAARLVITGPFAEDFGQEFGRVRELAPPQQAVVVATVLDLAVKMLDGDRATLVVFMDQQASRGVEAQPLLVTGRLTVTAQQVDGIWKIADVVPF
jgi:Mce-associated membrane protein